MLSVPLSTLSIPQLSFINKNFEKNILLKLRSDAIGNICRTDETILRLGSKFFWKVKSKEDKSMEVYKGVRGEMRCLAKCYNIFLKEEGVKHTYKNSLDMFSRTNFEQLSNVIEKISTKKDGIKAGLKQNLYYLIKKSATVMQYFFYAEKRDAEADELNKFINVFKCWQSYLFGDAIYALQKNKQVNLRKPLKLPLEEDLSIVRNHLIK